MNPIPLFTAEELKAIPSLSAQERDAIERACERNREWIATGASAVLVRTADVRELLGATAKLKQARLGAVCVDYRIAGRVGRDCGAC